MIKKSLLLFTLTASLMFGWGNQGHKLINKKAVEILPPGIAALVKYQDYITEHAPDPDNRKKEDTTERTKHYIDIDFYKEYNNGQLITDKNELFKIYGDSVNTLGTLPWATLETMNNLTKAFVEKNRDKILILTADLGHYVADGHQPMHTMVNYNGQLSGQKGIHMRYESEMIDRHLLNLDSIYSTCNVKKVDDPLTFIFSYISDANSAAPILYDSDKQILPEYIKDPENYYRLLWFKTKYVTTIQFRASAEDFASLIYTSWLNAGQPDLKDLK